jgi:hypothetical protein
MEKFTALRATLEKFLASDDFKAGVISSSKAFWRGSGYSVELLPNGRYQVLWNNQIGRLYETPGVILSLPVLADEDEDMAEYIDDGAGNEDDYLAEAFGAMKEEFKTEMREELQFMEKTF